VQEIVCRDGAAAMAGSSRTPDALAPAAFDHLDTFGRHARSRLSDAEAAGGRARRSCAPPPESQAVAELTPDFRQEIPEPDQQLSWLTQSRRASARPRRSSAGA
jgi:hypothetical protein